MLGRCVILLLCLAVSVVFAQQVDRMDLGPLQGRGDGLFRPRCRWGRVLV
jgi:hypothetical protein